MAAAPVLIPDYIFMWAFLLAFIGSIFFSLASLVNIDPSSIIVNKNVSFAINLIVGISGFVSLFVWFNMEIPALSRTILNPNVVKKNSQDN
jgi:ABC-type amino acid transport system permease subunit